MHAQASSWGQVRAAGFGPRVFDLFENLPALGQKSLAGLGQRQAPGGAVQQARVQLVSRSDTSRETCAVEVSVCCAAAVKLPASTTRTKTRIACSISIGSTLLSHILAL